MVPIFLVQILVFFELDIVHGGQDTFFDFEPLRQSFLLYFMDSVQIKPKSSGWQKKIFAPFDIFGGDVWINGECLLNVLFGK